MAQQAKNVKLIETDTSKDLVFSFSYTWSFRSKLLHDRVAAEDTKNITSETIHSHFTFMGERIDLDWYIIFYLLALVQCSFFLCVADELYRSVVTEN